jgi:hypothetical protein
MEPSAAADRQGTRLASSDHGLGRPSAALPLAGAGAIRG